MEAGTLNSHGLAGLNASLEFLMETGIDTIRAHEMALARRFYEAVREVPGVRVYGDFHKPERAPVVALNIGDYESGEVADELAEQAALIAEIQAAVQNKIAGAVPADPREGYQRVEYITTAEEGTYPYIITDFYGDNESGMELVASFPILQDKIPMGSREDSSSATRFYCAYPMSASSIYYGFNTGASISCTMKADTIYRLQTNFLNSRLVNAFDGNGGRKAIASVSGNLTPQSAPVSIFGYNNAAPGSINTKREFKLYSARCSQGYEVVREYIPCRRKSDGAVGLYEKFSGTFWGNDDPEGSAFAAGPDIDWEV